MKVIFKYQFIEINNKLNKATFVLNNFFIKKYNGINKILEKNILNALNENNFENQLS
jgi:hypothetical protein